jgi:hypothetical protein
MLNFRDWVNTQVEVDESEIDQLYDKSKISVELVKMYKPELLQNVSTIASLSGPHAGRAYGLYNSGENQDIIDSAEEQRLIWRSGGRLTKDRLKGIQPKILQQYYPDLDMRKVNPGDTIHVNIPKILRDPQVQSDYDAVVQIASTIVHECTHDDEFRKRNQTSELGPDREQAEFSRWLNRPDVQDHIQKRLQQFGVQQEKSPLSP